MDDNKISVAVVGDKGTGKTSIISSLYRFADSKYQPPNWKDYKISVKGKGFFSNEDIVNVYEYTQKKLGEYQTEGEFATEVDSKSSFSEYNYKMKVYSSDFEITFCDTPRMYESDSYSNRRINNVIKKADVIIVAVDAPSVMEKHDCWEQIERTARNCSRRLISAMTSAEAPKLIIFVPTKCEKYYYEGRLWEVSNQICELYHDFFEEFACIDSDESRGDNEEKYRSAKHFATISPIITMGVPVFERYKNPQRINSAHYHIRKNKNLEVKLSEKIFIAIANFLIVQNLCKTEIIVKEYTDDDKGEALLMLGAKGLAAMFGVRTPYARVNWDHLLSDGERQEVVADVLFTTEYEHGYKEFYR